MIYLARRYFGIGAQELFTQLPAWEVEVLFAELERELRTEAEHAKRASHWEA